LKPRSNPSTQFPKSDVGWQAQPSELPNLGSIQRFSSVTLRRCLILIEVFFLESCGSSHDQAPSLDVLGSYFPAWLISLAAAVMLTVIARSAGRLMGIRVSGFLGFLLCVSLILIFSISVWFKFFAS
jgi:hypothetical protein